MSELTAIEQQELVDTAYRVVESLKLPTALIHTLSTHLEYSTEEIASLTGFDRDDIESRIDQVNTRIAKALVDAGYEV